MTLLLRRILLVAGIVLLVGLAYLHFGPRLLLPASSTLNPADGSKGAVATGPNVEGDSDDGKSPPTAEELKSEPSVTVQGVVGEMLSVGDPAPAFTLLSLDDQTVSLSDLLGNDLIVLEFGSFT
jgi:hypothetical protein